MTRREENIDRFQNERNVSLKMEKKIKFKDNPTASKIIYAVVVAILAVSAIVVGIMSAASTKETPNTDNSGVQTPGENETPSENEGSVTFASPASGEIISTHSSSVPVFSETLGEWRIHSGIDICTDDGAQVLAAAKGEVSRIYNDEMLGLTVEITHGGNMKTLYSNLADDGSLAVSVGDKVERGDLLGLVGDTSISEIAEEAHLHFELLVNGISVNPLDYIAEKKDESLSA